MWLKFNCCYFLALPLLVWYHIFQRKTFKYATQWKLVSDIRYPFVYALPPSQAIAYSAWKHGIMRCQIYLGKMGPSLCPYKVSNVTIHQVSRKREMTEFCFFLCKSEGHRICFWFFLEISICMHSFVVYRRLLRPVPPSPRVWTQTHHNLVTCRPVKPRLLLAALCRPERRIPSILPGTDSMAIYSNNDSQKCCMQSKPKSTNLVSRKSWAATHRCCRMGGHRYPWKASRITEEVWPPRTLQLPSARPQCEALHRQTRFLDALRLPKAARPRRTRQWRRISLKDPTPPAWATWGGYWSCNVVAILSGMYGLCFYSKSAAQILIDNAGLGVWVSLLEGKSSNGNTVSHGNTQRAREALRGHMKYSASAPRSLMVTLGDRSNFVFLKNERYSDIFVLLCAPSNRNPLRKQKHTEKPWMHGWFVERRGVSLLKIRHRDISHRLRQ